MVEPVGIANLPNQRYKIVSEQGATFTIMLAGESGLGKTTFINTLFQTTLKQQRDHSLRHKESIHKTVEIEISRAELEEKNFKLRLNVIDTPGFGDNANNRNSWQPIVDFIDDQHDLYMRQEQQPLRINKHDLRVHCCLYFIRPTGHSLKPLDVEIMKRLSTRVNLVPVIAKADTLSPNEMLEFKNRIRSIIEAQDIRIYSPPIELDDPAASEHAKQLIESMPFAVIGSLEDIEISPNNFIKGRKYPWGIAEVENDQHCDFRKLRSLLLRTNMLDLILSTEELHYETYRSIKLEKGGSSGSNGNSEDKLERRTTNPKFLEEERALKQYFAEQVKNEEDRFKQWSKNIQNERDKLNKDLAELEKKFKKLETEVTRLEAKK
ncbi:hypothetical protein PACTADRAFT_58083 [Pachysolen tannophilus NRRL Y-2460]|uniref:Septin-type G domain-containing protein n=1 Tax=Pachysolen tannophilus NRRL Y-2460 TaxID=669874 RepID=A0A1E4TUG4_PACTA|nr:hypothetical protein PACTADRAFT_58083 [Pachysolen tannophilus NRRL Y-2460]